MVKENGFELMLLTSLCHQRRFLIVASVYLHGTETISIIMKLMQGGSNCLAFMAKINGDNFLEIIPYINISYHECIKKLNCHQPAISLKQAANMT